MYTGLLHTHSAFRYLILVVLIFTLAKAFAGTINKSSYSKLHDRLALISMILIHIQLIIGLILYFVSPKVNFSDISATMKIPAIRYYTVEHLILMLIAIALITIGRMLSKKQQLDYEKFKTISLYYGIALLIILLTVYWMMP
ncbi:MAG: cytochrome B [Bacteroidota bacterium]|jgi:hypothetical protein